MKGHKIYHINRKLKDHYSDTEQSHINEINVRIDQFFDREASLHNEVRQLKCEKAKLKCKLEDSEASNIRLNKLIDTMSFPVNNTYDIPALDDSISDDSISAIENEGIWNTNLTSSYNHSHSLLDESVSPTQYASTPVSENEGIWVTNLSTYNRFDGLQQESVSSLNSNVYLSPITRGGNPSSHAKNGEKLKSHALTGVQPAINGEKPPSLNGGKPPPHASTTEEQPLKERVTVTVIGSSIVRGVASVVNGINDGTHFDATGFAYPGHTAGQINKRIMNIPETEVTVLQCGTCNIEKQSVSDCTKEIGAVIDNVARKRSGKSVIMSLIPPRYGGKHYLNTKIDKVNEFIKSEVSKRGYWHLLQHDVDADDFYDGLHFNTQGVAKYAHEIRHTIRGIYGMYSDL